MRLIIYSTIAALAICYGIWAAATEDHGSDQVQVSSLVQDTAASVERRDLTGTVAGISQDYRDDNGLDYDRLRTLIAQAYRNVGPYQAHVTIEHVGVDGDRAEVVVHAVITGGYTYDRHVTIDLRKEKSMRALVIPTTEWRIVGTQGLGMSLEQF